MRYKKRYLKGKTGLSPVVATVLLISIVIAIAVIVFLWLQGFVGEAVMKNDENVKLVCRDQVSFESSYSNGRLSISNTGSIPIFNFKLKVVNASGSNKLDLKEIKGNWPDEGLNQGEAYSGSISSSVGNNVNSIKLIPVLVGKSDSQKVQHECGSGKDVL